MTITVNFSRSVDLLLKSESTLCSHSIFYCVIVFAVTLRSSADSKEYGSEVSCIAGAKVNGVWSLELEIRRTCVSKVRKYALFFSSLQVSVESVVFI